MAKNNESGGETVLAGAVAGVYLSLILIIFFNKFILAKLLHIYTDW